MHIFIFFGSTYEVNIFNNNICIFNIQKDSNSFIYSDTDRLYAEYDIKNNLSKEQLSEAIDAICNFDDIEDSFCRLECVFGAVLTIGYNYMTDQNIKAAVMKKISGIFFVDMYYDFVF